MLHERLGGKTQKKPVMSEAAARLIALAIKGMLAS
jgi:hypothetical protein